MKVGKYLNPRRISLTRVMKVSHFKDAVKHERVSEIVALIDSGQILPNGRYWSDGRTALHVAASKGLMQVLTTILKYSCDINIQDDKRSFTPLHSAMRRWRDDIIQCLLENEANPNIPDRK
jgi:ankyrin repeat protein